MPSGVKKRKAARKKKELEAKIHSSRREDFKSQNDHHSSHNSLDGKNGKLEKNNYDALPVLSTVDEKKSLDIERMQENKENIPELGFDGNVVVEAEKELTSAKHKAGQSISSDYIEPGKKFDGRDDENSSSSSAAECSITVRKTEGHTSSYKTNVCDDKSDKSSPATIGINESAASVGECINSLAETALVADSVKSVVPVSIEKIFPMKVAAGENLVVSDIVTSGMKEDANSLLSDQCNGNRASSFTNLDSLPNENGDKVLPSSVENDQKTSSTTEQGHKNHEEMFLLPVSLPVGASKDDANTKDSDIPICSKNQNSASAPMVAQTSIFSCCGLFDLLKGSN